MLKCKHLTSWRYKIKNRLFSSQNSWATNLFWSELSLGHKALPSICAHSRPWTWPLGLKGLHVYARRPLITINELLHESLFCPFRISEKTCQENKNKLLTAIYPIFTQFLTKITLPECFYTSCQITIFSPNLWKVVAVILCFLTVLR